MVEFVEINGNYYHMVCSSPVRATTIVEDIDLTRYIPVCTIESRESTGRDPRTHHAFTHHICAEHNIVVKWVG